MEPEGTPEERILKAASEVFLEKGIQEARMQEIADLAGISKAMLNYSFRSKEKLLYLILVPFARSLFSTGSDILNSDLTQDDPRPVPEAVAGSERGGNEDRYRFPTSLTVFTSNEPDDETNPSGRIVDPWRAQAKRRENGKLVLSACSAEERE